jgi:hypothetical protein
MIHAIQPQPAPPAEQKEENLMSLGLMITLKNTTGTTAWSMLSLGDMVPSHAVPSIAAAARAEIDGGRSPDVLKLSHHGSAGNYMIRPRGDQTLAAWPIVGPNTNVLCSGYTGTAAKTLKTFLEANKRHWPSAGPLEPDPPGAAVQANGGAFYLLFDPVVYHTHPAKRLGSMGASINFFLWQGFEWQNLKEYLIDSGIKVTAGPRVGWVYQPGMATPAMIPPKAYLDFAEAHRPPGWKPAGIKKDARAARLAKRHKLDPDDPPK